MIAYLDPLTCIGDFEMNTDINSYLEEYRLKYEEKDESTGWKVYTYSNPRMSLYVERNLIVAISCEEECLYKGQNLIGMSIHSFMQQQDLQPDGEIDRLDFEEDGVPQLVYEFDNLGLQIWVKNDLIVTIIANNGSGSD